MALVSFGTSGCGGDSGRGDAGDAGGIMLDLSFHPDGAHDAGPDTGPHDGSVGVPDGSCFVGLPCDAVRGCNGGEVCETLPAGTGLSVYNCAGGPTVDGGVAATANDTLYLGGYCTNTTLGPATSIQGMSGACNPNAASDDPTMAGLDGCPACSKCVALPFRRTVATDPPFVQCMARCTPSATDNSTCRTGYECNVFSHACEPFGCQADIDCQIYGEDTDGNGTFDNTMGDRYCQDGTAATCNTTTGRCQHPAHTGALAGSACLRDSDCEANGQCLTQLQQQFPGGYCTAFGCDVMGLGCANTADKCQNLGQNEFLCLEPCTVNNESVALSMGTGGHGDTCRAGYQCLYDDHSPVGSTNNGGCWLGQYNAVTTNNVGHSCTGDDQCYSPHGAGRCIFQTVNQSCSILGCAGYPDSVDICGAGNSCFAFTDGSSACLKTCTAAADCMAAGAPSTDGCIQLTMADTNKYCWPACTMDTDCLTGHTCIGATMTAAGNCSP